MRVMRKFVLFIFIWLIKYIMEVVINYYLYWWLFFNLKYLLLIEIKILLIEILMYVFIKGI